MSTLQRFSDKERAYDAYQARQHYLRIQGAIQQHQEELQQALAQERAAREAALRQMEAERQAKEAALAEVARLQALLRAVHPQRDA